MKNKAVRLLNSETETSKMAEFKCSLVKMSNNLKNDTKKHTYSFSPGPGG